MASIDLASRRHLLTLLPSTEESPALGPDTQPILAFSRQRWESASQYEQNLLERFAVGRRVFYFEEPVYENIFFPYMKFQNVQDRLFVIRPHLPKSLSSTEINVHLRSQIDQLVEDEGISSFTAWYFTPYAFRFSSHLYPRKTIYDFDSELFLTELESPDFNLFEAELFKKADLVLMNGYSRFQNKKEQHQRIYPRPHGVDLKHFKQARNPHNEPDDQAAIPFPRIGFSGFLNDSVDVSLIERLALARPNWNFVMTGGAHDLISYSLPRLPNIHHLSPKKRTDLPKYMAGWNLAILPLKVNDSTKFFNPTETLEYLAAGRPVVSTALSDVVRPFGDLNLVSIARTPEEFLSSADQILQNPPAPEWLQKVDLFLGGISWDEAWGIAAGLEAGLSPLPH